MAKFKLWIGGETPDKECSILEYGAASLSNPATEAVLADGEVNASELLEAIAEEESSIGVPTWEEITSGAKLAFGPKVRGQYIGVIDLGTGETVYLRELNDVNANQIACVNHLSKTEPHDEIGWNSLQIFYEQENSGYCSCEFEYNHLKDYPYDDFRPGGLVLNFAFIHNEKYKILTDIQYMEKVLDLKYDYVGHKINWYTIYQNKQTPLEV